MKTPEEMAEEYVENYDDMDVDIAEEAFLAVYKAAQEDAAIEIEHLKALIEALRSISELWQEDLKISRQQVVFWKLKALE